MPTPIKMPALSPTMEEGTLARWLVKVGDEVRSGDIMAEIETDKATMEFEAVDEGRIAHIAVEGGTEGVAVGTVIATLAAEGEDLEDAAAGADAPDSDASDREDDAGSTTGATDAATAEETEIREEKVSGEARRNDADADADANVPRGGSADDLSAPRSQGERIIASPLARRIARQKNIDLAHVEGSGPRGRIVKADLEQATRTADVGKVEAGATTDPRVPEHAPAPDKSTTIPDFGIPHEDEKLNNVRKVIARRLTEAKQTIPHIYLTVDVQLDALLKLRGQLNAALEADGIKLSVNDLLIKALAKALLRVPACNVSFAGDSLRRYSRADISVAVAAPSGLITPIITDAGRKPISVIATEMKDLAARAREQKLKPAEYQGGTASLSNLGMFGIKQFDAVINPPQAMILAVGAGEKRPHIVDDSVQIATVMSATGSFDHRAIDGADGAELMKAFKMLVENPLGLVA